METLWSPDLNSGLNQKAMGQLFGHTKGGPLVPLVDGATAFGQLLLYGQATSVPDQQDAVIPNSSKLVDNQYLFRDMLDADLITPQQAQQARSHEAPVYPEECGLQHYVPTSPRPRVVPQFLLERPNSRVPTQHGHTHVYGHRDTVPSARPMPLQVLPAPTHMATRPPSFAYNQPSSNANGHPTPTCRTPTAPASRGRGGGAGKRRRQQSTSVSDDGGSDSTDHSSQSARKDGPPRPSRTRSMPKRFGATTKSYADIDSEEEDDVSEDEAAVNHRQARKARKQKMKRASATARSVSDTDKNSAEKDEHLELDNENEKELRAQLKVLEKDLENANQHAHGLSTNDKKKLRNRKASRVSRLRKKLSVFDLTRKYIAVVDACRKQAKELETYRDTLARAVTQLQVHQPEYSCSLLNKPLATHLPKHPRKKAKR